jgi:S1-C subfamily serine protease
MRSAFLFLLGLMIGCHNGPSPNPPPPAQTALAQDLATKTVALLLVDEGEVHGACSGVWVSQNKFLTAQHCVSEQEPGHFEAYAVQDLVMRPGALVASDEDRDLALVEAFEAPTPHGIAHTSSGAILVGAKTHAMGHPLGLWWSYSSGEVSRLFSDHGVRYLQTIVPVAPGMSGGGLFDDQGHLIGIVNSYSSRAPAFSYVIHRDEIDAFLKGLM